MARVLFIGYAYALWNRSCSYCNCLPHSIHNQTKTEVSQFKFGQVIIVKKKAALIIGIIIALVLVYLVGSGFLKNTSAYIEDYAISADGTEITLNIGMSSSMGYIRNVSVHQQEGGKPYLDCYSAFGGMNGSIRAKDTFIFHLDEETSIIGIYRSTNCYEEVLVKSEDGSWQRTGQ